jgi:putative hydrolase of the HAD superfamily
MAVSAPPAAARDHALELWKILGPDSLALFADAESTLRQLKSAGFALVITSNWECGLGGFCRALGLGSVVDHVIASAEVGWEKPDHRIFDEAARRLGVGPDEIVHVGDSRTADWEGARNAGLQAVLLDRQQTATDDGADVVTDVVTDLAQVARLLGVG